MPALSELPLELIDLIVFDLEQKDVSAVSRACKRLRSFMIPYLYDTIIWTWDTASGKTELGDPPIHFLLRTLVENAHLGAYVKHISFSGTQNKEFPTGRPSPGTIWRPGEQPKCTTEELKALKDYVHTMGLPSESLWIAALEEGNINVFVALVLSQLHNLQRLHLSVEFHVNTKFLGLLLKRALFSTELPARLSTFSKLEHVEYSPMETGGMGGYFTIDIHQVTSLFYLPSIHTINAVLSHQKGFYWPGGLSPRPSRLRTLNLLCCEADEAVLLRLAFAAPTLETLRYDRWINNGYQTVSTDHFDLGKLKRALVPVQITLKHLSLSISLYCGGSDTSRGIEQYLIENTLGNLRDFEKLESLEIPFIILLGNEETSRSVERLDGLPRSLRYLCVRDDLALVDDHPWWPRPCLERLEDFLVDWKSLTPRLERIDLLLEESDFHGWDKPERDEWKDMCKRAGLACTIIRWGFDLLATTS